MPREWTKRQNLVCTAQQEGPKGCLFVSYKTYTHVFNQLLGTSAKGCCFNSCRGSNGQPTFRPGCRAHPTQRPPYLHFLARPWAEGGPAPPQTICRMTRVYEIEHCPPNHQDPTKKRGCTNTKDCHCCFEDSPFDWLERKAKRTPPATRSTATGFVFVDGTLFTLAKQNRKQKRKQSFRGHPIFIAGVSQAIRTFW